MSVEHFRLGPKPDGRQMLTVRIPDELHAWVRSEAQRRGVPQHAIIKDALELLRHTPAWRDGTEDET